MKESADPTRSDVKRRAGKWQGGGGRCGAHSVLVPLACSACARGGAWQQGIQLLEEYTSSIELVASGCCGANATGTGEQLQAAADE
jgi:hypothetical protein